MIEELILTILVTLSKGELQPNINTIRDRKNVNYHLDDGIYGNDKTIERRF